MKVETGVWSVGAALDPSLPAGQGRFHWRLHFELDTRVSPAAGGRVLQATGLKGRGGLLTQTVPFSDGRSLMLQDNGKVLVGVPRLAISSICTSEHTHTWGLPFLGLPSPQ